MDVVTVEEVKNHLGIDYTDDMVTANINRAIQTADAYLKGAIGDNYPVDNPKSKELALMIVSDIYDDRGLSGTMSTSARKLVDDLSWQLRLELRRGLYE